MAAIYELHPENPQPRRVEEIKDALRSGAVMLYPTDTVYAIGCDLYAKSAVDRVKQIKRLSNDKPLTFLCSSLSNVSQYAVVSDESYRLMKHLVPGTYTFLLPATKLVPKLVLNPKRKTTGIRVPDHFVCQSLLSALENPIISTSAQLPDDESAKPAIAKPPGRAELFDKFDKIVDLIIDSGQEPGYQVSTILDLTNSEPAIVRKGLGWQEVEDWMAE